MPSASPSPAKRPLMQDRTSSTPSLSSSGRPAGATKPTRPHYVSRHSRNISHGKGLSNMPKKSMSAVYGADGRNHARKKSGTTTPVASPKVKDGAHMKWNSSHVVLPKNRSHGNLRKNHSAKALSNLNRNRSLGALDKLGAPAEQKAKNEESKQGVFDLAGSASEDEDEGEWEDSTASPELTRNNSKVSTPARAHTPNGEPIQKPPDERPVVPEKTSSPPEPTHLKTNKSAPDLRPLRTLSDRPIQDPPLLQTNGRASRAPPAMTTATARAEVPRNDSQRSLLRSSGTSTESYMTNGTPHTIATPAPGQSTSGSAGVSHFLTSSTDPSLPRTSGDRNRDEDDTDSDSQSVRDFMSTYKPQPHLSESPEKPRHTLNKARIPSVPSRTQQKLELQRREVMRGNAPPTPAAAGLALSAGSSASIHSGSASKGRNRGSLAGDFKFVKQDYDTAVRQLTVVRRFRNPVLESLGRLRQDGKIGLEKMSASASTATSSANAQLKRPPSRHGRIAQSQAPNTTTANGTVREHAQTATTSNHSNYDGKGSHVSFQTNSQTHQRHPAGRVQFQLSRQASQDDVNTFTTSQGSPEVTHDDEQLGMSAEEALIRRMWESRVHVGVA